MKNKRATYINGRKLRFVKIYGSGPLKKGLIKERNLKSTGVVLTLFCINLRNLPRFGRHARYETEQMIIYHTQTVGIGVKLYRQPRSGVYLTSK